jgi:hypothetical protein
MEVENDCSRQRERVKYRMIKNPKKSSLSSALFLEDMDSVLHYVESSERRPQRPKMLNSRTFLSVPSPGRPALATWF